jgi:quinol monooxygenase YgiN
MLVNMHRIASLEANRGPDVENAIKKAQLDFRKPQGCMGLRLLRDRRNNNNFIAISYWCDDKNVDEIETLNNVIETGVAKLRVETSITVYKIIQELQ